MKENTLFEILEHISSAVYIVNQDGELIYSNVAAEELDNFKRNDVIDKHIRTIYKNTVLVKGQDSPSLEALEKGKIYNNENLEWFSNGKIVNALTSAYPIYENGKIIGAFAICDDVKTLKRESLKNVLLEKNSLIP